MKIWHVLPLLAASALTRADERFAPAWQLELEGYTRVEHHTLSTHLPDSQAQGPWAPHSLRWPVAPAGADHVLGNVMAEYQPFDSPAYFHGGLDLLTDPGSDVRTPVAGRLEAGHYSYADQPDGSMIKYFKPWPAEGEETYFEVAVVTDEGDRFEFHHVNRGTLPAEIVTLLNAGGGRVEAGALVGHPIVFGGDSDGEAYNHIHYNIVTPDGTRLNPEYFSPLIPDTTAPEILGLANGAGEVLVATRDLMDHQKYSHPPTIASLRFASGATTQWDFTRSLTGPDGKWPDLRKYFSLSTLDTTSGQFQTDGGYGSGLSVVRLAVPPGAQGAYTVVVSDAAGNRTVKTGSYP